MLIVPEIQSVIIQPPRTGSTALRDAVQATYPKAITLYRHMERPGIPAGYENWDIYCLIRDPFDRMVSIYNYMTDFRPTSKPGGGASAAWIERLRNDTDRPFADWLADSLEVFTDPINYDGTFLPYYNVMEKTPIARKSQYRWARPDLGPVTLIDIKEAVHLYERLGVKVQKTNASVRQTRPEQCDKVQSILEDRFQWDLKAATKFHIEEREYA
ncbi:hypothetical protein ACGYLO_18865 [Sulfitobacter sp. 1A13353]|uniref:hypothetical protein n=1 Tax=Sulfitobacter sp. 1A13353 TaxID=3368568 RepID=UPI003747286E